MVGQTPSDSKSGLGQILSPQLLADAKEHDEIERRFVVAELPKNLEMLEKEEIQQSYLQVDEKTEIRIRAASGKYYVTEKVGIGLVRKETEVPIPKEIFDSLLPRAQYTLNKTRYFIPLKNGNRVELNVYKDKLCGLNVAEIEFDSVEEAQSFQQEDWFSFEATYDHRYYNANLAKNGRLPDISLQDGISQTKKRIEALLTSSPSPVVVLIAGGSGCGKTYLGEELKKEFGEKACLLHLDDYYYGPKYMQDMERLGTILNFDQPEAVDLTQAATDLEKLLEGSSVTKKIYDFSSGPYKTETVSAHQVVIVEGLFALSTKLEKYGAIKVFIDTTKHDRLIRKLLRDLKRTTWPASQILGYTVEVGEPMYEKYVEPTKINADIILKSNYDPGVESKRATVLESQIKFKINGTPVEYEEKLRMLGAEVLVKTQQTDTYYNARASDIIWRDELVRIRREPNMLIWTYKGPNYGGNSLVRRKLDVNVYSDVEKGLSKIYREVKQITKTRLIYRLDGAVFTLDFDVKTKEKDTERSIGNFLEFRHSGSEEVSETLNKVKAALQIDSEGIRHSYFTM